MDIKSTYIKPSIDWQPQVSSFGPSGAIKASGTALPLSEGKAFGPSSSLEQLSQQLELAGLSNTSGTGAIASNLLSGSQLLQFILNPQAQLSGLVQGLVQKTSMLLKPAGAELDTLLTSNTLTANNFSDSLLNNLQLTNPQVVGDMDSILHSAFSSNSNSSLNFDSLLPNFLQTNHLTNKLPQGLEGLADISRVDSGQKVNGQAIWQGQSAAELKSDKQAHFRKDKYNPHKSNPEFESKQNSTKGKKGIYQAPVIVQFLRGLARAMGL